MFWWVLTDLKRTFKPRLHATLVTLTAGRVPRERTKRKQKNGVMMVAENTKCRFGPDLLKC